VLAVVWRVSGEPFDVDSFVSEFGFTPDRVWRKGEARRGKPDSHLESGFNLSIDRDDDDLAHAQYDMRTFLRERKDALSALRERGIRSTIDIGITVGGDRHYTRSVRLPPEDLAELGRAGIELMVSAYPGSEDDELKASG